MESPFNYYVLCILVRNHECSENENQRIVYAYLVSDRFGQYVFSKDEEKRKIFSSEGVAMEICEKLNSSRPIVSLENEYGWKVKSVCEPGRVIADGEEYVEQMMDLVIMGDYADVEI